MVAIQGFRVSLQLKSGEKAVGTVDSVVDKTLTLSNGEFNNQKHHQLKFQGTEIADLKVIDLPKDFKKGKKSKSSKNDTANNVTVYQAPGTPATPGNITPQQPKSSKQKSKKNVYHSSEQPVWGDSNVSAIKASDDFDFSGNTARFDKDSALEEFALRDNIDESQRLVGLNKKKTKYEHDENVLSAGRSDGWDKENTAPTASEIAAQKLAEIIKIEPPKKRAASRVGAGAAANGIQLLSRTGSPLPLATPVQLLEVERLTNENFKLTPHILAENCSRGLATLVIKMLGGDSRVAQNNHNLPPLVLLLVGNNRAGARALATGRQLANHGVRTIAFTLTDSTKLDEFDDQVAHQLELFTLCGGKCVSHVHQLTTMLNSIETPVELVLDALQGYDTSIGDLWGAELQTATDLIKWVNETSGVNAIVSLDIPAGIDAGSGLISTENNQFLECKFVVSTGLPLNGLVLAYSNGLVSTGEWDHYLVDIGVPQKLFKKGNLRKFDRSWFDGEFLVPLEIADKQ